MQYKGPIGFSDQARTILPSASRRRFVQGLVGGGLVGSTFAAQQFASAAEVSGSSNGAQELSGTVFNLVMEELPVNFTGKMRMGLAINGSIPAPTLRWREGDEITINVTNKMSAVDSMVNMITLARQYEAQIKMMKTAEETDTAATQLLSIS